MKSVSRSQSLGHPQMEKEEASMWHKDGHPAALRWQLPCNVLPLVTREGQHWAVLGPGEGKVKQKTANMPREPAGKGAGDPCTKTLTVLVSWQPMLSSPASFLLAQASNWKEGSVLLWHPVQSSLQGSAGGHDKASDFSPKISLSRGWRKGRPCGAELAQTLFCTA